jgi:hypothetical protein
MTGCGGASRSSSSEGYGCVHAQLRSGAELRTVTELRI